MHIERRYTKATEDAYAGIEFRATTSEIRNPDGSVVFKLEDIQVPSGLVAGGRRHHRPEVFPQGRRRQGPEEGRGERRPLLALALRPRREGARQAAEAERYGSEIDSRQVFDRLAGTWTYWGWKGKYFDTEEDARAFYDELRFMLATQKVAPNSPQWFNTGLHWAYGIDGPGQGHFYVDPFTASSCSRNRPTSIRSRMPASSSPSATTSSTRAASWTCGCARRACSSTARAPARTSRSCAARASGSPAAASPRA
jgi:ribonucleoside-diphosphate reductase alpha chain